MKKHILTFLILSATLSVFGQTPETNLQKYWNCRERLKKHFVAVSPNDEISGFSESGQAYCHA